MSDMCEAKKRDRTGDKLPCEQRPFDRKIEGPLLADEPSKVSVIFFSGNPINVRVHETRNNVISAYPSNQHVLCKSQGS